MAIQKVPSRSKVNIFADDGEPAAATLMGNQDFVSRGSGAGATGEAAAPAGKKPSGKVHRITVEFDEELYRLMKVRLATGDEYATASSLIRALVKSWCEESGRI